MNINKLGDGLIVVDVQRDFCPGGALAVPEGDQVVSPINRVLGLFRVVVFTQDWHPSTHISFSSAGGGGKWPDHCVAGTPGADFHPDLQHVLATHIVRKGISEDFDAYSGFDRTGLAGMLRDLGISRVFIGGLATDYCVRATAMDALREGFGTVVLGNAVRGVNLTEGDAERAMASMIEAGVVRSSTDQLI